MPDIRLSRLALADLRSIAEYTAHNWNVEQAEYYLDRLQKFLNLLAANPSLGRACNDIRKGYRRMEHERHVVFYRAREFGEGIDVIRILHERMLPTKHLGEQ
ncbi:MAG: type II toxin-antitoxin system RelE/ParE family toxin [Acidobacteriaceae bacterium]